MRDVLYLRPMDPPVTVAEVIASGSHADSCFDLHQVTWVRSYLAEDGRRMLCWYRAVDAESVRLALRKLGADLAGVLPVTVLRAESVGDAPPASTFIAEWWVADDSSAADIIARAAAANDRAGSFRLMPAFVGNRGDRMIGAFPAGDEDRLRARLERAGIAPDSLWSCTIVTPEAAQAEL